jgi:hypothetical protein
MIYKKLIVLALCIAPIVSAFAGVDEIIPIINSQSNKKKKNTNPAICPPNTPPPCIPPPADCFRCNEWDFGGYVAGIAGSYNQKSTTTTTTTYNYPKYSKSVTTTKTTTSRKSLTGMGGGFSATYWYGCYHGVQFGVMTDDTLGGLNGNGFTYNCLQGNLVARVPIQSLHFAPYGIVGGGSTWGGGQSQGNGNVGCGVEYRNCHHFGIFVDTRYMYGNNNLCETLTRAGVSCAF